MSKGDLNFCMRYFICKIKRLNNEKVSPQNIKRTVCHGATSCKSRTKKALIIF